MSEKEKAILENLSKTLPKLSEEQKAYFSGVFEGMALMTNVKKKSKRKSKNNQV
ncbi:MAG: hypothetical protein IKW21_06625 [Lachnospiraceae bacterium]|nr:hypothetical protein [Lachnospiraceae bacterium]